MTKIIFLLFLISNFAWASDPLETESNVRVFKTLKKKFRLLAEYKYRDESQDNTIRSVTLGGYYRLHTNFKFGLFYSKFYGQLHNEDWKWIKGKKRWDNTDNRAEELHTMDLTWRNHINETTVFEFKTRYSVNQFNDHHFFRVRPGVTHFIERDGLPFLNLFFQYELYLPENGYSDETVYERWGYAGVLYHWDNNFKWGGFLARKKVNWDHKEVKSNVLGLNLYYYF